MLDNDTQDKICALVRTQPRTIQEIAHAIDRNWRTADAYVTRIERESGLIATRTFRGGTKGALKIAYWRPTPDAGTSVQQHMLERIAHGRRKEDFSPFDIYQFVEPSQRAAYMEMTEFSKHPDIKFDKLLLSASRQVIFFSGNLSWMELGPNARKAFEELARRRVSLKVLTRVDITSEKNVREMLALNKRFGTDIVEIRHCEQPLRAIIVDDAFISMKEVLSPLAHRELRKKHFMFFIIREHSWVVWLQQVFWHLWQQSIDAQTRTEALATLKRL